MTASGVVYEEYRCVYGEDAESALRFLFNAMAPKAEPEAAVLQGIPTTIYHRQRPGQPTRRCSSPSWRSLGVRDAAPTCRAIGRRSDEPARGRRARSNGRSAPSRRRTRRSITSTQPKDEAEANLWMRRALVTYNNNDHRAEPHSRIEDWLKHLPQSGVRAMVSVASGASDFG